MKKPARSMIRIRGARQHHLKNVDVDIEAGTLTVVTGPSGSGKSSLVFDTLFAQGQRQYVETFSAYARQFLDRMDKPQVDAIEGVFPAIAIDQMNAVRTSRSTVGTMTQINDYVKILFSRLAVLYDRDTGQAICPDTPESVVKALELKIAQQAYRLEITFAVPMPSTMSQEELMQWLSASGFARIKGSRFWKNQEWVEVIQDRLSSQRWDKQRCLESVEAAMRHGQGCVRIYAQRVEENQDKEKSQEEVWFYSAHGETEAGGAEAYATPSSALFSFNSPMGACATCRGFGRVIGVDKALVVPDVSLSLRAGAIKVFQTPAWKDSQEEMLRYAEQEGISCDVEWALLSEHEKRWVFEGSDKWAGKWNKQWYGVNRFFEYLESKSYKMHIRVLLSKYRSYTVCPTCQGARLKKEALWWRIGTKEQAMAVMPLDKRLRPLDAQCSDQAWADLPGLHVHDVMQLPLSSLKLFIEGLKEAVALKVDALSKAQALVVDEIAMRLHYLCDVGLGYLTLDRQSRTLSGGEVQRIHLTTALGSSLVNTLFVLDEPSMGLHPRDMNRVVQAIRRLRDAGNTVVVVDHDPVVIAAADRVIDMGPAAGAQGGQIVFDGRYEELKKADTLTGAYLGRRRVIAGGFKRLVTEHTPLLILKGVKEHNLKNIEVKFPLQRLVVVTGVSGSGKSTLVQEVLVPALMRHWGQPVGRVGDHECLLGAELLEGIEFVDQSPIGKTVRSAPVSYVGSWDVIRQYFAREPLSVERAYTAGHFSFNSGDGRCPLCSGSGFEHVEMQFLSDVYLRCQECDGQRYRKETLEVRLEKFVHPMTGERLNVADVLALTVEQATRVFAEVPEIVKGLQPLVDVGLSYLCLGQAVPTLSGGEAQRLKLAGFLVKATKAFSSSGQPLPRKGLLLVFDEPTTGLHFDDVSKLMDVFRRLLAMGHSIVVVEHHIEVIKGADWLIDLGLEAGEEGGYVVAEGPPKEVALHSESHTAKALRDDQNESALGVREAAAQVSHIEPAQVPSCISIVNAREHNLKSLSVNIPRHAFNVISGVSGSGKSTLAFHILFNEGQRRYLESLGAYARSMVQSTAKPDVDAVVGIEPTVAIEQRLSRGGMKSTVGTLSEIHHYLRLLWVKLGQQHCVHDGQPISQQSPEVLWHRLMRRYEGRHIGLLAPLVLNRKGLYTEWVRWAMKRGYSHLRVDGRFYALEAFPALNRYQEHTIELPIGSVLVSQATQSVLKELIDKALLEGNGCLAVLSDLEALEQAIERQDLSAYQEEAVYESTTRACAQCGTRYAELEPRLFSYNSKLGWCPDCMGTGWVLNAEQQQALDDTRWTSEESRGKERSQEREDIEIEDRHVCLSCSGTRLNLQARSVYFKGLTLDRLSALSIQELHQVVSNWHFETREQELVRDLIPEIISRLSFLIEVGLSYLSLDRGAPTLSGGEAQRIRLAAQLGGHLQGVCYVLDEPTIGLHASDHHQLLSTFRRLVDKGNTLVVVEHDEATLRHADHVIDVGPGAGSRGGYLVAQGSVKEVMQVSESVTGRYLRDPMVHFSTPRRSMESVLTLGIHRPFLHHLKKEHSVDIPLNRLVAIAGVSGSGKSTLIREVLMPSLHRYGVGQQGRHPRLEGAVGCDHLTGFENIDRLIEVDQTPIGKTSRSCPATYVGLWDDVRKLFSQTLEAKARGYTPARFSFNTGEGRCVECEGNGVQTIEMSFLPSVKTVCEACDGARFNEATLEVKWREKSIGDVLRMEVDEAVSFFSSVSSLQQSLALLQEVGLGYLTLGQASPTLSGGEAQRIKLVSELVRVKGKPSSTQAHTLYVLDEPTVGLHMADVERLVNVLHRLVDAGHSVMVIEHHLDVIAQADWVIEMGPEGGKNGGQIVAKGTPQALATLNTKTGKELSHLKFVHIRG